MNNEINSRILSIKEGKVPLGYKKTKVGIIPNDWAEKNLSDLIEGLETGVSVNSYDFKAKIGQKAVLKTSCVSSGKFNSNENKVIIEKEVDRAKLNPKSGEIIISRMNTPQLVGEIGYIEKDYPELFLPDRLWQSKLYENVDGKWLAESLITEKIKYQIKDIATGTSNSMKNISKPSFLAIKVPFTRYEEQKKIASILVLWDKSIELKEKFLQEKQKQKKGLMERLLTGKVRLNGFNNSWQKIKLGSVMKERKEVGYNDLELLAITSANGVVRRTEVDIKDNSSEDKSKYKRILPGDIGYNTMRMWQGVSGLSKYEGIVSPAYTILKPTDKVDSEFMSYLFKLPKMISIFHRNSQGLVSDTLNLKYENFKGIKVSIPMDIEEQKVIADLLKAFDNEIKLLQKEIELLKVQKKGLMQLLLTGIVRVNCD